MTSEDNQKQVEIIPAVLPRDFFDIEEYLERVVGVVPTVQIDIVDGVFVPGERTWPYVQVGDDNYNALLREEESFPFLSQVAFEVDLMVADPLSVWQDWVTIGAGRIIAHVEALDDVSEFLQRVEEMTVPHDSFFYIEKGIAIGIETPLERIAEIAPAVDVVQCMGIASIGKQGQEFDARVIERIKQIKKMFPGLTVSVDGGVNAESAPLLREAGADRLVSGSYIFNSDDVEEAIQTLQG